jgi:hypothetical protein
MLVIENAQSKAAAQATSFVTGYHATAIFEYTTAHAFQLTNKKAPAGRTLVA